MIAERPRLAFALLVSLLIHALLLSLTFGGEGPGLPGFTFPWQERRIEAPDLRVVLMPAPVTAAEPADASAADPLQQASMEPAPAVVQEPRPPVPAAPTEERTVEAMVPAAKATAPAKPEPDVATVAVPAKAALRAGVPDDVAPAPMPVPEPLPVPEVIAAERPARAPLGVPAAAPLPTTVIAAAPAASSPGTVTRAPREGGDLAPAGTEAQARERAIELARLELLEREAERQAARQEAARRQAERAEVLRLEAERKESERKEAERKEAERQDAARREAARREALRVETARLETERKEAERKEAARQEAVRREADRVETARLETERKETERKEAERKEAARQEAARQEAARQAVARQEAARIEAAQEDTARREAARRAMGRQLDEEAARREAASTAAGAPPRLAPSASTARRGRLFGRTDANAELVLYAEAWARKIQLNMTFDMVRDAVKRPYADPLVTVAIRSDGSVESVTFVISSGVPELDEAIRRVVQSLLPYPAFPPALAREFDVIEIRRTWRFDMAIRLF